MFIILHCRVLPLYLLHYLCLPYPFWCITLVYLLGDTSFCTVFIGSPCCDACLPSLSWFIPVQLTAEPMCSRYQTDNKAYQHIISKAALLNLLSATVGPEHEPLLLNRVVNPWQPEFCTQCGAYGQWTGPQTCKSNDELLGDIPSHPQLKQHHQLAHVSWLVAHSRSHTKNDFFPWKNTCKHMTFIVRLTGQHQSVSNTISYTSSAVTICAGRLCPVTIGGHCDMSCHNPLHSQGECGNQKEPHRREGSCNSILRWTGSL